MRTTIVLDEKLFQQAAKATGIEQKTKLIHLGLKTLIREEAQKKLAKLFGSFKEAKAPPRRKMK